jgi:hypothetical protein
MESGSSVIFPDSMVNFLANLVSICFCSFPAVPITSATAAAAVHNAMVVPPALQVGEINLIAPATNLLEKTHPATRCDLIKGMDRIINMMQETLQICEQAQRSPRSVSGPSCEPFGLTSSANVYSDKMAKKS